MKYLLLTFFLTLHYMLIAQTSSCEYKININDSVGDLKETAQYLIHETVFAGHSKTIFLSLMNSDGTPVLNFQSLNKSKDFMVADCFDKNSRIYFQLSNGKIYSLIYATEENCSTPLRNEDYNIRVLTGSFLFMKDNFDDLKKYSIIMMRVKYSGKAVDYILKKELKSEIIDGTFEPERYFTNYFKCVE